MDKLVYLDQVDGASEFLQRAAWQNVDGVELDITDMTEEEYLIVKERVLSGPVETKSLHYGRTRMVSLQEWDLFRSQLQMMADRAQQLDCSILSVHPPKVEKETSNTMKDLREFVAKVDVFAQQADVKICFALDGFMKDPQMINVAFADLQDPALGVMIDLDTITNGIDPVELLDKLDVDIHKVRFPMSVRNMTQEIKQLQSGTAVVAESLK